MDLELNRLQISNFKNIEEAELNLAPKINCFVGLNGAGKTNILDAIYYLAYTKSYFNNVDTQNIKYGEDFFLINGEFNRQQSTEAITIQQTKEQKTVKRNGKRYTKLSAHIGLIPLVIITPDDIKLIQGGSEERRKFIDLVISLLDPQYLQHLVDYRKILQQRNKLIKTFAKEKYTDREMLELWDEQLIKSGNYIHEKRKEFMDEFLPVFFEYHSILSSGNDPIDIRYKSQLNEGNFEDLLKENLQKDIALEYTATGIHKDDLVFTLRDKQLKKTGSQGQQKTFLLTLKFAQSEILKRLLKIKPILLLDDIFDKLDASRINQLLKLVATHDFGQIFITHTNRERLEELLDTLDTDYKIFSVQSGKIEE